MPKILDDEKIFDAIMQVVMERGYEGATTKQMATAANVSEVTLFRKYENKKQLVQRAITYIIENSDFESSIQYTGDIRVDLLKVLQAYKKSVVLHGGFFIVLFSEIAQNPELASSFAQPIGIFRSIGQLLGRYQAEGVLQKEHPLHSVTGLLGPVIYAEFMRMVIPNSQIPEIDMENHVNYYLEGRYYKEASAANME